MTTAVELIRVLCANALCPRRSGQVLGEVERGAHYRFRCFRCGHYTTGRA